MSSDRFKSCVGTGIVGFVTMHLGSGLSILPSFDFTAWLPTPRKAARPAKPAGSGFEPSIFIGAVLTWLLSVFFVSNRRKLAVLAHVTLIQNRCRMFHETSGPSGLWLVAAGLCILCVGAARLLTAFCFDEPIPARWLVPAAVAAWWTAPWLLRCLLNV